MRIALVAYAGIVAALLELPGCTVGIGLAVVTWGLHGPSASNPLSVDVNAAFSQGCRQDLSVLLVRRHQGGYMVLLAGLV